MNIIIINIHAQTEIWPCQNTCCAGCNSPEADWFMRWILHQSDYVQTVWSEKTIEVHMSKQEKQRKYVLVFFTRSETLLTWFLWSSKISSAEELWQFYTKDQLEIVSSLNIMTIYLFWTHEWLNWLAWTTNDSMRATINNNPSKSCVNALL